MAHQVLGLYWGGGSYAQPTTDDVEVFQSRQDALDQFRWRYEANGKIAVFFNYGLKPQEHVLLPAVDRSAELRLWPKASGVENMFRLGDLGDAEPVWVISFGPRGGVRITGPGVREVHKPL